MPVHILEIGFGTGLNAFLSLVKAAAEEIGIVYTGVEAYPVRLEEITQLNYPKIAKAEAFSEAFEKNARGSLGATSRNKTWFHSKKTTEEIQQY